MRKKLFVVLIISALFCLSVTYAIADEPLFVQPFSARIFAKPSIASEVLGSVDSGYKFVTTGRDGSWVKLYFNGKQGFIPAVQTAKNPPLGKATVRSAEAAPKLSVRSRTSSAPAVVAGMKGLTYEDRARVSKGEQSDFDALDRVESLKISPEELRQFQSEGGKR